jgi:serine/threonine protein phosphatase PrpC
MDEKKIPVYGAAHTDPGGRRNNEDAVYTCDSIEDEKINQRGRLYIVADGTGGQEGGRTASSMAAAIINEHFYDEKTADIEESLRTAIKTAHEALYELAQKVRAWAEMSTTLVAAVVHQGKVYIAHVGDSRAYLIRDGQARLLTRDHVWLEDDDNYGALTRWLGGARRASVDVDVTTETLQEEDTIVLCSDGLTDVADGTDIARLVGKETPEAASQRLIELANRLGTGDNISVAVIQYGGKAPVSSKKQWAWIGAGGTALVGLAAVLALLLPGGGQDNGNNNPLSSPTATPLAKLEVESTSAPTSTPTPLQAMDPSEEEELQPTSTPVPATPTFTPRPTLRPTDPPPTPTPAPPTPTPEQSGGGGGGGNGGGNGGGGEGGPDSR